MSSGSWYLLIDILQSHTYFSYRVKADRKKSEDWLRLLQLFRILSLALCLMWVGCSQNTIPEESNLDPPSTEPSAATPVVRGIQTAPGLEQATFIAPLTDAYNRIDPTEDGWDSEAFSAAATKQLKLLAKILSVPSKLSDDSIANLFARDTTLNLQLKPARLSEFYRAAEFLIQHGDPESAPSHVDPLVAFQSLLSSIQSTNTLQTEVKLYRVDMVQNDFTSHVLFNAAGQSAEGQKQINTEWLCRWTADIETPHIKGIDLLSYEESTRLAKNKSSLLKDCTADLLGHNQAYQEQLLRSTDHWRARLPVNLGLDVVANHGMALGDVNGDGLDDLYLCQQGGLPNRLFLQNPDGTLTDHTAQSGADWLDYCASALIVDLDNDGDCDLVVSQDFKLLLMENDGFGRFELSFGSSTHAQTFSINAADFDLDGDLDIYACGYNPSADRVRSGALGEPLPYHDAQNGGKNMLLRNDGGWQFNDVTETVGLGHNNNRFSFAAAWEDYDDDGDPDLYVANDYGRNNLYKNTGGRFVDVAAELGIEDMSAGMSASWADFNRDG
ncbi:MAG: VCBS repeat-containing protein, partial [Verrucomicrobiota bacterium]|nr:VCBS repeat-containing protein [Verrucomicrobiota bacterium]